MNIDTISCNECGAPLNVPDSSNYVTCNYCSSRLKIHHSESVTYSEVIDKIDNVSRDINIVKLQNTVDFLDKSWDRVALLYSSKDQNGNIILPSIINSLTGTILLTVLFSLAWLISYMIDIYWFSIFLITGILIIYFYTKKKLNNLKMYKIQRNEYIEKRNHIVEQINNT